MWSWQRTSDTMPTRAQVHNGVHYVLGGPVDPRESMEGLALASAGGRGGLNDF